MSLYNNIVGVSIFTTYTKVNRDNDEILEYQIIEFGMISTLHDLIIAMFVLV